MSESFYVRELTVVYGKPRKAEWATERLDSSSGIVPLLRKLIPDAPQERMVAILFDVKQKPIGWNLVGVGGINDCPVAASTVLRAVLVSGAVSVILCHNHPSGETTPSPEDIVLTERINSACELVGVRLLDHIIIGENESYFSFLDAGLLDSKGRSHE